MDLYVKNEITIGQLSARTGVAISAIRYYETQGLIAPNRNAGGQRRFPRSDIRRISFILICQQFGFTLTRIRELMLTLPNGRTPTANDWAKMSVGFQSELDAKIHTLQKMRDNLDGCIGCGCLSMQNCALYNPTDSAAENGTGPRYLMGDSPA